MKEAPRWHLVGESIEVAMPSFRFPVNLLVFRHGVLVRTPGCRQMVSFVVFVLREVPRILSRAQVVQLLVPEEILLHFV